ncbi:hypothetical protein [Flagellimonas sp. 2504JD4-2]
MNSNETGDFELVATDGYSGIEAYEASIISDTKSLNKFYSRINKTRKPGLPVPAIDFSKDVLVVMCLGEQNDNISPMLKKVESEDNILVTIELSKESDVSKTENPLISYPFYIYSLPRTSKSIKVQKMGF